MRVMFIYVHVVYGKKLEDDIIDDTSGHLKRILISMVQANRPDTGNTVNRCCCLSAL